MTIIEYRKKLGALYTDRSVARFLVRWAIRRESDTVLDPAFGDGVFLDAALDRLRELGRSEIDLWDRNRQHSLRDGR